LDDGVNHQFFIGKEGYAPAKERFDKLKDGKMPATLVCVDKN